jgi:hypothetical protein
MGQKACSIRLLKRAQPQIFSNYFVAISFLARGKMLKSAKGKGPKLTDVVRLGGKGSDIVALNKMEQKKNHFFAMTCLDTQCLL